MPMRGIPIFTIKSAGWRTASRPKASRTDPRPPCGTATARKPPVPSRIWRRHFRGHPNPAPASSCLGLNRPGADLSARSTDDQNYLGAGRYRSDFPSTLLPSTSTRPDVGCLPKSSWLRQTQNARPFCGRPTFPATFLPAVPVVTTRFLGKRLIQRFPRLVQTAVSAKQAVERRRPHMAGPIFFSKVDSFPSGRLQRRPQRNSTQAKRPRMNIACLVAFQDFSNA